MTVVSVGSAPLFSVIIPTYNRADLLGETLDSVFAQRFTDFEIIVVDDGSTDVTGAYLDSLAARIKPIRQRNGGPGAARNMGAQQAAGLYLAFLDSDDLWLPWSLATYASVVQANTNPAFVAGKPFVFLRPDQLSACYEEPAQSVRFPDYLASGDRWRWSSVSSFVIRRDVFLRRDGFARALYNGEDGDLAMRLGVEPGFVQITAPATFGRREHAGNITHDLHRNVEAIRYQVGIEKTGGYPGGPGRGRERRRILMRHLRPVAYECARQGRLRDAWAFYAATLSWQLAAGAWKFIIGLPLMSLLTLLGARTRKV